MRRSRPAPTSSGRCSPRTASRSPKHERSTGGAAFYQIYETRDGRHIVLAGQEPKFIRNLLGALKRDDLVPLCLRGPGPHQQPVIDFLAETFRKMSSDEAQAFLSGLDVCFRRAQHAARGVRGRQHRGARLGPARRRSAAATSRR